MKLFAIMKIWYTGIISMNQYLTHLMRAVQQPKRITKKTATKHLIVHNDILKLLK